jgi:hypothetical protein
MVRGGLGRTGLDSGGNSGILPQSTVVMYAMRAFPNTFIILT